MSKAKTLAYPWCAWARGLVRLVSTHKGVHHRVQRPQLREDFDSEVLRPFNHQRQYRNNAEPSSWPQEIAFAEAGERFVEFTKA